MGLLADLFVRFSTKGQDQVAAGVKTVKEQTEALAAKFKAAEERSIALKSSLQGVVDGATTGFARASAAIGGFVTAGIAASSMGQVFSYQMTEISRQIASLFLPQIQMASRWLQDILQRFRALTGEQQRNLAGWLAGIAAASATLLLWPKIVAGIAAVGMAWKTLSAAFTLGLGATGVGALVPLLALVAAGIAAILVGTEDGRAALADMGAALKDLGKAFVELAEAARPAFAEIKDLLVETVKEATWLVQKLAEAAKWLDKIHDQGADWAKKQLGEEKWKSFESAAKTFREYAPSWISRVLVGSGEDDKDKGGKDHMNIGYPVQGFESLSAGYERLALASIRATSGLGKTPEEETAENTGIANTKLGNIEDAVKNQNQPLVRGG